MSRLKDAVYGFAVADALGVPFEFKWKGRFECTDMVGYGSWNRPRGTWSDDTSMTLATCDSIRILGRVDSRDIMERFQAWFRHGKYAIDGDVFDVGNTVSGALERYDGTDPICGIDDPQQNGNGALMRILPLAFTDADDNAISDVARITHGHSLSTGYCIEYVRIARSLLRGESVAFQYTEPVKSSGFVRDTFNAVMYSLSSSSSYRDAVLTAVNLGNDTDTVAAITGGLAGIIYGYGAIPSDWIEKLRGKDLIDSCLF